jgi:Protein of unknown function (DUF1554)
LNSRVKLYNKGFEAPAQLDASYFNTFPRRSHFPKNPDRRNRPYIGTAFFIEIFCNLDELADHNHNTYMKTRLALVFGSTVAMAFAACGGNDGSGLTDPNGSSSGASGSTASGGMTSGGMTSGGMTSGGMTSGGMTSGGVADSGASSDAQLADADTGVVTDGGITMSFFVSSTGSAAMGGNLGGLAGADLKCQTLAASKGLSGKTWKAYLSDNSGAGVDAKDRIGAGPWYNQKGTLIAMNVAALHANGFQIPVADVVDESGAVVPTNEHDILTGTARDGTADGQDCMAWTSAAGNRQGHVGHSDAAGVATGTWNDAHDSPCSPAGIAANGGKGRIYCFASN